MSEFSELLHLPIIVITMAAIFQQIFAQNLKDTPIPKKHCKYHKRFQFACGGRGTVRRSGSPPTMAEGGRVFQRSSSVACDTDILQHRGSVGQVEARPSVVSEDVQTEGEELFETFLSDQIQREGLEAPPELQPAITDLRSHQDWTDQGSILRQVADQFATTQERQNVRQQAQQIDINSITSSRLHSLLDSLFYEGHITRERIVVLFFFCSDVAIRTLRESAAHMFRRLLGWIVGYIRDKVCRWVAENGGWGAVLSGSIQFLRMVIVAAAVAIVGWTTYRWWRGAD